MYKLAELMKALAVQPSMALTIIPTITLFLSLLSSAYASWRFDSRTLVTARVDPLISPGSVSGVSIYICSFCMLTFSDALACT